MYGKCEKYAFLQSARFFQHTSRSEAAKNGLSKKYKNCKKPFLMKYSNKIISGKFGFQGLFR